jgi:hypothetical protein
MIARRALAGYTAPVGLFGSIDTMARVRAVTRLRM